MAHKIRICVFTKKWGIDLAEAIKDAFSIPCCNATIQFDKQIDYHGNYDMTFVIKGLRDIQPLGDKSFKVLVQTEQLQSMRSQGSYNFGTNYDLILELFKENSELPDANNKVVYFPLGYSKVYEMPKLDVEKDIDVLFWGSPTPYRKDFYKIFPDHINFIRERNKYGDILYKNYISRAKISIWIKHHGRIDYSQTHCLWAQCNKEFVMFEETNDYGIFKPNVHFIPFNKKNVIEEVEYWLSHEKERKEFAESAHEDFKKHKFNEILFNALKEKHDKNYNSSKL